MNIEGVNLLSLLPAASNTEGGSPSLSEKTAIAENFANALIGQIKMLSAAKGQIQLPGKLQNMTMPQTVNSLSDMSDLLNNKGAKEELSALLDKYLPPSYKKIEGGDLNKDGNLEATLLALTDTLKSMPPGMIPDELATALSSSDITASNGLSPEKHLPEVAKLNLAGGEYAASGDLLQKETALPLAIKDDNFKATLIASTDTQKSMPSGMIPDELATALINGNINITASNGLSPEKHLPEEAKLNLAGGGFAASGDLLQKETALPQLIKDGQGFNLQTLQNAEPTEKTQVVEKHVSNSEPEKTISGLSAEMIPFHSPADIKTDSLAISRPLDHPDWSKDLGEQIVWMNNKTMSAAEIKLNPEHLGPISVRIDIHQDQASIMFTAHHAEAKEAIESSIPKLREMLDTQQLNLINVNISQNSTPDQGQSQSQTFFKMPENHDRGINGVIDSTDEQVVVTKGLLSIYA